MTMFYASFVQKKYFRIKQEYVSFLQGVGAKHYLFLLEEKYHCSLNEQVIFWGKRDDSKRQRLQQ